jgi:heme-degrading monooxygenase HmoA
MSVPFVNCFEVPAGREDAFMALWGEVNAYMAAKPGYLSHWLHRSLSPDARYRFINYVQWETPELWEAAHDDGFRRLVSDPRWREFTTTPALYEVVHEGHAGSPRQPIPAVAGRSV